MFFFVDEMRNSIVSFVLHAKRGVRCSSFTCGRATRHGILGFGRALFSGMAILSYTTILLTPVAGLRLSISSFLGGMEREAGIAEIVS